MIVWDMDWREPFDAFAPLAGTPHAHLLHGGDRSFNAEWSIIAALPVDVVSADCSGENPFVKLQALLKERAVPREEPFRKLPFISGAVGFVGYEAAQFFEPCLTLPGSPFELPDVVFGLYDAAALFSRRSRTAYIAGRTEVACRRLRETLGADTCGAPASANFGDVSSNFTKSSYEAAVAGAIENILDGDYYQANLSQQFKAQSVGPFSPFELFRTLASKSDAFHGALLQYEQGSILSNSPERFFRVEEGGYGRRRIVAEPIKGTMPRGASPDEDSALAKALTSSPKDRAENIMIADLLRNDLSRICADGTIREETICALMTLSNVHHLVSRISGILNDGVEIGDIFAALFPCGSVTGAPKIEAMKAIARIEGVGRGPYCGGIGYIDDSGSADFAVAIRTLIAQDNKLTIPVGGGVTLRSDPAGEYEETLVKARGSVAAIGKSMADFK